MVRWIIIIVSFAVCAAAALSLTIFKEKIKSAFYIGHMERDERVNRMQVEKIIDRLRIAPGDIVADVGVGTGFFSRKIAPRVSSSGKVYAVDINRELLNHIDRGNRREGIENIQTVAAVENDPRIPHRVDLIFICDTLHYIDRQQEYVKTLSGYLKSDGRIAVISFKANWPPMSNKFTEKDLVRWMSNAGLELADSDNFMQDEYLMIFKNKMVPHC